MGKRGQATIFVVLGIVIVVLVALFLVGRQTLFLPTTPENLAEIQNDITEHIQGCVLDADITEDAIIQIGLQGGYLTPGPDTYRIFNDTQISYLCYNMDNTERCRNRLLLRNVMEEQLNEVLQPKLLSCVGDLSAFGRFKPVQILTPNPLTVDTQILQDVIVVNVNYEVVVASTKDETKVPKKVYTEVLDYPLGDLYLVAQDILEKETTIGEFDPLLYMLAKRGEYVIYKQRPYPDKLYTIKRNDHTYIFQFFVQGQPS